MGLTNRFVYLCPFLFNFSGTVNVKYDALQQAGYISLEAFDMSIRLDGDGTFMLSVRSDSPLKASLKGICGNMDGDYAGDKITAFINNFL